jgi:hypothetical protein
MDPEKSLTNEDLKKAFANKHESTSQFDLVNHAIRLAEIAIGAHRDAESHATNENIAVQVQEKIKYGRDSLKELSAEASIQVDKKSSFIPEEEGRSKAESRSKPKRSVAV